MTTPRVTVIIAAYNYAQFIGEALDSVLAQTLTDWECVVVDDGSTDATPEIVKQWVARDSRFRYVGQENRGPNAARNVGLSRSSGDYVQFLDADDRLAPSKLAKHARYLDEHSDADIVYGPATFFRTEEPEKILYSRDGQLSRPLMPQVSSGKEALRKLQMFNIMPILAALTRRSVFDRVGKLNESVRTNEDWDFWLRCAIGGCEFRYVASEESLAFIRTHPQSASRSSERLIRDLIQAARTFKGGPLPLIYEMAAGIDDVESGRRLRGVRRIVRAARGATSNLVRMRWLVYAAGGLLLPRRAFTWVVTRPMPERGLEIIRSLTKR
ncbi:MAG TPA: glycosyltransferase [Thermoanaerobaculia bacterium]|jgi:glycosyltransferase involved in cell wall biosynthesis|nr:glycosyltransferase [Thermoanaerobaculia bacterium]